MYVCVRTVGMLQRMSRLLAPTYWVQFRTVCIHPVVKLITPSIKVYLQTHRHISETLTIMLLTVAVQVCLDTQTLSQSVVTI